MNCQEFNRLVDGVSPGDIAEEQREAIDQHLASCSACSEDWANWREIAALAIPATPAALRGRIAAALPTGHVSQPLRAFRPFVIGGVVLMGAAAAAVVAWRSARIDQGHASPSVESPQVTAAAAPIERETGLPEPAVALPEQDPAPAASVPVGPAAEAPLDPLRFLVLHRPEIGADPEAIARTSQCHDAVVSRLRAIPQFEVIADGAVSPQRGSTYSLAADDAKNARARGAGHVLSISTQMGCAAFLIDTRTGMLVSGVGGQLLAHGGYAPSAAGLAQTISDRLLRNPATLWAEARATLLNGRLGDKERTAVLWRIREYQRFPGSDPGRSAFDEEMVAAAAHLGATSPDPDVRGGIWAGLRAVNDAQLIQPLLKALASDPNATVRVQAAFTLRTFLNEPGVREALQRAAAEDPDSEPAGVCCTYTVREAAERASVRNEDFREWVRAKLYDESLPARSRLRPLEPSTMDGRLLVLRDVEFGAEAARVVFDLGRHAQDPRVRVLAWDILHGVAPDDSFVPELLGDLAGYPDEYVRANAAKLLIRHAADPDVRKALDKALEDPSMQVRIAASGMQRPFRR